MPGRRGPSQVEISKARLAKLSGYAYLAVRPKDTGTLERVRIIKLTDYCDHVANVCHGCARYWGQDYELLYDRTAGGRALRERVSA